MARISLALHRRGNAVRDARSCERWLTIAPLADSHQACSEICGLLDTLAEQPPAARGYLDVLDRLFDPVRIATEANSKRFSGRPLPLSDAERTSFDTVEDLLTSYGRAYHGLALAARQSNQHALASKRALLIVRAMQSLVQRITLRYSVRREITADLWHDLHDLFGVAETFGIENEPAGSERAPLVSAFELYVRILLLHLASPYSLSVREQDWAQRWLRKWAGRVSFGALEEGRDQIGVDLDDDEPPHILRNADGPSIRILDFSALRGTIRRRLRGLKEGQSASALGLGADIPSVEALQLVRHLKRQWLDMPVQRQFKRREISGDVEVALGFAEIHRVIGGRMARDARPVWQFNWRDAQQLATLGKLDLEISEEDPYRASVWQQLDDSANGFRLRRESIGARLTHRQLIALRPEGAPAFILAEVRWLTTSADIDITIGVQSLPGLAQPIAARAFNGRTNIDEPLREAFVLSAMSGGEASLLLPTGLYRDARLLELQHEGTSRTVKLIKMLQQGTDFERVTFALYV